MKRFLKYTSGAIVALVVGIYLLWPAEWVVKGPMLDMITGKQAQQLTRDQVRDQFTVPEGFTVGIFGSVVHARVLRFSGDGSLLVVSTREKQIIKLEPDRDGDGASDGQSVLLSDLERPHGLAIHKGWLYVGEESRISRWPFDQATASITGARDIVFAGFPTGGNHRTRTIGVDDDGWLYATTGSTCNVCQESEPYRATMVRMRLDGSEFTVHAEGLRNSVGFDWQPETGKLFATDNGRDLLGDELPDCELNEIIAGEHYGWPYAMNDRIPDPDFGPGNMDIVNASMPMAHGFGGHRAPLGMRFLRAGLEPTGMEGAALVALHGSWNRSTLAGYKVVSLHFDEQGAITQKDFMVGFEKDGKVYGRPADVEQGPDGAIYVADDYTGVIYRVGTDDKAGGINDIPEVKSTVSSVLANADQAIKDQWLTDGKVLYGDRVCASCHAAQQGKAAPLVKALDGIGERFGFDGLVKLLETPPGNMPDPELTADERAALAYYLLQEYP